MGVSDTLLKIEAVMFTSFSWVTFSSNSKEITKSLVDRMYSGEINVLYPTADTLKQYIPGCTLERTKLPAESDVQALFAPTICTFAKITDSLFDLLIMFPLIEWGCCAKSVAQNSVININDRVLFICIMYIVQDDYLILISQQIEPNSCSCRLELI